MEQARLWFEQNKKKLNEIYQEKFSQTTFNRFRDSLINEVVYVSVVNKVSLDEALKLALNDNVFVAALSIHEDDIPFID